MSALRVIGVDPGVATTGFAVVEREGAELRALAVGAVRTPAGLAHEMRLERLHSSLRRVVDEHRPDAAAVERVLFNANVRTAMAVGQASGVALLAMAQAGLSVTDYTPLEVKGAVVGVGSASKRQVQVMVANLLGLSRPPAPPDAADACALAICHLNRQRLHAALRRASG